MEKGDIMNVALEQFKNINSDMTVTVYGVITQDISQDITRKRKIYMIGLDVMIFNDGMKKKSLVQ